MSLAPKQIRGILCRQLKGHYSYIALLTLFSCAVGVYIEIELGRRPEYTSCMLLDIGAAIRQRAGTVNLEGLVEFTQQFSTYQTNTAELARIVIHGCLVFLFLSAGYIAYRSWALRKALIIRETERDGPHDGEGRTSLGREPKQ